MISISNKGLLLQRFHNIYEYMCLKGEHINKIYKKIEDIESDINEMTNEHKMLIETNKNEIENVNEIMVTKSEINDLLQELTNSINGLLPSLPVTVLERPSREEQLR